VEPASKLPRGLTNMKEKVKKVITSIKKLPEKKHHLDFIAALLTIPVLLSVIILNYNNLNNLQKSRNTPTPAPGQSTVEKQIIITSPVNQQPLTQSPTSSSCIKDIGPVEISYPKDGQTVSDNPMCIIINYDDSNYCSVVWSYSINGGTWSNYTSNNPCIYNLVNGNVTFNLRVQSTVVQKEVNLTRNFIYQGTSVSPTPATSSATLH
jgi:hypothetical protein